MQLKRPVADTLLIAVILLGAVSLFVENTLHGSTFVTVLVEVIDFLVFSLFLTETVLRLAQAPDRMAYVRSHPFTFVFAALFTILFTYNKFISFFMPAETIGRYSTGIVVARSAFIILKVFTRMNKIQFFISRLSSQPAVTIIASFLLLILGGTALLIMPAAAAGGVRVTLLNALFTATSAVCVTGLAVVDTATRFSRWGQFVIMLLIQTGGLGIMVLSSFTAFLVGKRMTLEERMALSYMLNENDMTRLARSLYGMVLITFAIEGAGALLLYPVFSADGTPAGTAAFFACFHAISAFCNAGFALFSNSLEGFRDSLHANTVVAGLIILGSTGFGVIMGISGYVSGRFRQRVLGHEVKVRKLSLDTRVVATVSGILLLAGTLLFYALEHGNTLKGQSLGSQYLSAFFQSVTLRTAGFNTVSFSSFVPATYFMMLVFMFIGGASGSTAGGIKVNSVGAVFAYIRSLLAGSDDIILGRHALSRTLVNSAFLVIFLGLGTVFAATGVLLLTETHPLMQLLFETTSAFATVGLSAGITAALSGPGKTVIILLMFIGRLGPLTIMAALSGKSARQRARYPSGYLNIG